MRSLRMARLIVPAALGAILLTGCTGGGPGTAAVVESKRLTVEQVQQRTAAFFEAYPEATSSGVTAPLVSAVTVENFIRAAIVDAAAADVGLDVSAGEMDAFIDERGGFEEVTRLTSGQGVPPVPELVRAEVRSALLQRALGEERAGPGATEDDIRIATREAVDEKAAELDIEVNPRYGTWDGSTVTPSTGSLSVTPEELNPPAGGIEDPAAEPQS